jgi:hypothetical protein
MIFGWTGVIIDATTSLAPAKISIFTAKNNSIDLGNKPMNENLSSVFDNGLICYSSSIDSAKESGFVGNDPLVIHAISRIDSEQATDVIIPPEDAKKIISICKKPDFLGKLKIAYIL